MASFDTSIGNRDDNNISPIDKQLLDQSEISSANIDNPADRVLGVLMEPPGNVENQSMSVRNKQLSNYSKLLDENLPNPYIQPYHIYHSCPSKCSTGNTENVHSYNGANFSHGNVEHQSMSIHNKQLSSPSELLNEKLPNPFIKAEDITVTKVPPLNIQLLLQSKMSGSISFYLKNMEGDRKISFKDKISNLLCLFDQFIEVYNDKQKEKKNTSTENSESYRVHTYDLSTIRENDNTDYAKTYYCQKKYLTEFQKSEISHSEPSTIYDLLIFFSIKTDDGGTNIFAATTGNAWQIVRPYNDINFPIKIIKAVGSTEKIKKITRRSLFENITRREMLLLPRYTSFYQTSSLYYLVEKIRCEMNKYSSEKLLDILKENSVVDSCNDQFEEPPKKKKRKDHINYPDVTITTGGSIKIKIECEVKCYFKILKFLENYLSMPFTINNNFDFLHFFEMADDEKDLLDDYLISDIFDRFKKGEEQSVTVQHKMYEPFLLSKKFDMKISEDGFQHIGSEPPDIHRIIQQFGGKDINKTNFIQYMKKGILRFDNNGKNIEGKLIDYIEGEILYSQKNYLKIRSKWYQMYVDYLSLLQQDFEKVMDQVFVREVEEGGLSKPWIKEIPLDQTALQKHLAYNESSMAKLMEELRNANVSYIADGIAMQKELVGEILEHDTIKKYKKEIETALKESPSRSQEDFENFLQKKITSIKNKKTQISKADIHFIWEKLIEKRPVLQQKKDSIIVKNPFPYSLCLHPKYGALKKFLYRCTLIHQEKDYNLSYQNFQCKGHNYLVFDTLCPDSFEACDILSYTSDKIYLYHVKEDFGHNTRVVCSQILNSATRIQEALRTNQDDNYLQMLWNLAVEYKGKNNGRINLKNALEKNFSKETFIDMFFRREIVFVYAYLSRGFEKMTPSKPIPDTIINVCKELKLVNDSGFLTSECFQMSEEQFFFLISRDNTINRKECDEAFDTMIFDYINELCKHLKYVNKFGALTTKFLRIQSEQQFIKELLSKNKEIAKAVYEKAYHKMSKRRFSKSALAKLEVIRLAEKLGSFQNRFKFKICEIPLSKGTA